MRLYVSHWIVSSIDIRLFNAMFHADSGKLQISSGLMFSGSLHLVLRGKIGPCVHLKVTIIELYNCDFAPVILTLVFIFGRYILMYKVI